MDKLDCRSGGGLMVVDRENLGKLKAASPTEAPDFAECLSILVDVEGRTDQVQRWSGEDWLDVWRRETQPLVACIRAGEFAAVVFRPGDFFCDLDLFSEARSVNYEYIEEQWIYVPSGVIVVADLGKTAEDWEVTFPVEHESFDQKEISTQPGWYKVSFMIPKNSGVAGERRRRKYGSETDPYCVVRCVGSPKGHRSIVEIPAFPS